MPTRKKYGKRKKDDDDSGSEECNNPFMNKFIKKVKGWSNDRSDSDVYTRGNHIVFKGDVNRDNVYKLGEELETLNKEFRDLQKSLDAVICTPKPIYLHLNTYGGYLDDAWAAVDFIKSSKIPVHTIVEGRVASAGTLMSVVGQKRYMTPHSRFLIHQLRGGMWGKFADMEESLEECKDAMDDIVDLYLEHTNMTEKQIRDQLKKEKYWDIDACKRKGFIDEVWKNDL
uniref:Protease n=1 Tax=viral metagenome TaxID=1070528 RepID=A0A6C0LJ68_9ZZZZ